MTDFITRIDSGELNKRAIESLINGGAFDSLGGKRSQYLFVYLGILSGVQNSNKRNVEGQMSLFGDDFIEDNEKFINDDLPNIDEFENSLLLKNEKAVLGVYLTGHPLNDYLGVIKRNVTITAKDLTYNEEEDNSHLDGKSGVICGVITTISTKFTRNNAKMCFINVEDLYGEIEVIVFPKTLEKYSYYIQEENSILIKGTINLKDEENGKVIANEIKLCDNERVMQISITNSIDKRGLFEVIKRHTGESKVIIKNTETDEIIPLDNKYNVFISSEFLGEVSQYVGEDNILIK